jgi:predicted nucleic acid-binding protein
LTTFLDTSAILFEVMRRRGIARALAVDGHFDEHGFEQIPG